MMIQVNATLCSTLRARYLDRIRSWRDRGGETRTHVARIGSELLRYGIVMIDVPFAYSERGTDRVRQFVAMAEAVSDEFIVPGERPGDRFRLRGQNRFACLSELEKWTLPQLKEFMDTALLEWQAGGTRVLWVLYDQVALDLGCVTVLDDIATRAAVHVKRVSLRHGQLAPRVSGVSALETRVRLGQPTRDMFASEYLVHTDRDETRFEVETLDAESDRVMLIRRYELPVVHLGQLALYQRHDERPRYARACLADLRDLRQVYTLSCYVSKLLFLVGSDDDLRRVCDASERDLVAVPGGEVRLLPARSGDLWSSL